MMYSFLKNALKTVVNKKFLFWSEPFLRRTFIYPVYIGKKHQCTVCNAGLRKFIPLPNGDTLCPKCGSISRDRRLMTLLKNKHLERANHILDFSPSRSVHRQLKKRKGNQYITTDLSGDFLSDKNIDIKNIDSVSESYDLIICYHILEHVKEDQQAMQELYRVLRKNGTCFVQTPFKSGEIYEDSTITSETERLKAFGQEDHVRIYSVNGLKSRLETAGFKVKVLQFAEKENNRHGFAAKETILELTKS